MPARRVGSIEDRQLKGSWLFFSGPAGDPPETPEEDSVDVAGILEATRTREHRVFSGKLGFAEKVTVLALRVPVGDFRDWDSTRERAEEIALDLVQGERSALAGAT